MTAPLDPITATTDCPACDSPAGEPCAPDCLGTADLADRYPDLDPYTAACLSAATAQGLDPIVAAMRAAGYTVAVEQTGGFCMAPAVHLGTEPDSLVVVVTRDGLDESTPWLVGVYTRTAWVDAEAECSLSLPDRSATQVIALLDALAGR